MSAGPVAPGDELDVTINNVGLADGFGFVVETLPAGFSYVAGSATSTTANAVIDVEVSGQTVTFTVVAVDSFRYRVMVGADVADGPHTFSGVLTKLSGDETIADSAITVEAGDDTTLRSPRPRRNPPQGCVDLPGPRAIPDLPGPGEVPDLPGPREIPEIPDLPGPRGRTGPAGPEGDTGDAGPARAIPRG